MRNRRTRDDRRPKPHFSSDVRTSFHRGAVTKTIAIGILLKVGLQTHHGLTSRKHLRSMHGVNRSERLADPLSQSFTQVSRNRANLWKSESGSTYRTRVTKVAGSTRVSKGT